MDKVKYMYGTPQPKDFKPNFWLVVIVCLVAAFATFALVRSCGSKSPVQKRMDAVSKGQAGAQLIQNNGIDGSVLQAEQWLRANLKDWDSYQSIEWGPVAYMPESPEVRYVVWNKYRAKNSFGAYEIEKRVWWFNANGDLIDTFLDNK